MKKNEEKTPKFSTRISNYFLVFDLKKLSFLIYHGIKSVYTYMGKHSIHFNLILDGERGPHAPPPIFT